MPETIKNKRPMIKETVGALYYAFNTMTEKKEFNPGAYEATNKSNVVKNIGTSDNSENTTIRASGEDYETVNQMTSIDSAVEVIAIDPEDLARMKGDDISDEGGLILGGAPSKRPFFAFGKVVKKLGGGVQYKWYPKCQLIENSDDISTSEEKFNEQNDTITIRAYAFDKYGNKFTYVDSETTNFPEGITEEKFFEKPILTKEDLVAAVAPGT